jgi:hypothetical protein
MPTSGGGDVVSATLDRHGLLPLGMNLARRLLTLDPQLRTKVAGTRPAGTMRRSVRPGVRSVHRRYWVSVRPTNPKAARAGDLPLLGIPTTLDYRHQLVP